MVSIKKIIALTCLVFNLAASHAVADSAKASEIEFIGEITHDSVDRIQQRLDSSPQTKVLKITSQGGDISAGLRLGRLVYKRQLDIIVNNYCVSSCANYVFPAARNKVIGIQGIVVWHGGARNTPFEAIDGESPSLTRERRTLLRKLRRDEFDFYRQINVRPALVCAGAKTAARTNADGWTMTVEAMKNVGINFVRREGVLNIPSRVAGVDRKIILISKPESC